MELQEGQRFRFAGSVETALWRDGCFHFPNRFFDEEYFAELEDDGKRTISPADTFVVEDAEAAIGGWSVRAKRESDGERFCFMQWREPEAWEGKRFDHNDPSFVKDDDVILL